MLSVLQHLTSQKLESAKQFHLKWRKERQNIYLFFEDGKVTTKQKQFSEEKHFIWKGLNQFYKLFTTDKQYIQKHLKHSHSDKWIFLSLFSSDKILKIPAEKLYGIISFDSYAIVYM